MNRPDNPPIDPALDAYLRSAEAQLLSELCDWLRIPSVSTLPQHKEDIERAAGWLARKMTAVGLENVELIRSGGHPIVYADWLHAGSDAPTLLVYGHYDVQPADPLEQWTSPPFEPTVRGDDLFARGASDDKGQLFAHVAAVQALLATSGSLPVNVKFVVEGEEEDGSQALMDYVPAAVEKLAADACLISDTHMLSPQQPLIIYGLRGMWGGEITVRGPARDLHSGMFGGAVHNPNQALCELLARLHDEEGRVTVPGFYDRVEPLSEQERAALARVPYDDETLLKESGAPAAWGEAGFTVTERIGARPTLEINGMWGGFTGEGFKTVIPAEAQAKVSCRLVPDQDSAAIGPMIERFLAEIAPPTVEVSVRTRVHAPATVVPLDVPEIGAASRAFKRVFGADPVFSREGGSIPVATVFQETLDIPILLMGLGLPDDNLHAPNEKLHLPNHFRGVRVGIALMEELNIA
ncbi:MAG: dipeptidase [Caldilineaceae bacterium]|nr:dipeptidase [Caldilineaceae bacterium]MDE0429958.1 dipeptidase [Caldilineaceae bacterium]